ncbi:MAG TPA: 3-dehydroquinate synthase [Pyrinomonadaceae bacterium]|jgi:3-dehydroquinate synthase|nr:3-dehydroquinate synthase [Pyrinomonadaceae bacterium]
MHRLQISLNQEARSSEINIGTGIRRDLGHLIPFKAPRRIAIITNERVAGLYGREVVRSLKSAGFKTLTWVMPEGERYKSFRELEKAVNFLSENRFERDDLVLALGGGVVGDLAGFAAAVYLRGLRLVQVPTTLLSQIDSSVGGKTGINLATGKNLVGAFHQPASVFIDTETLATLPPRELTSGFCEMVKQALVANPSLFKMTVHCLQNTDAKRDFLRSPEFEELIAAQCGFKASIVANDERESTSRADTKSRRVLNFGHTTAHALETVTNYRFFRHGEAVGYGMLVAGELSRNLGLIDAGVLTQLREAVSLCGPLPRADNLDLKHIIAALKHDKKSVGGQINWVLLEGIGRPRIVEGGLISAKSLRLSLRAGLRALERQKESFH